MCLNLEILKTLICEEEQKKNEKLKQKEKESTTLGKRKNYGIRALRLKLKKISS